MRRLSILLLALAMAGFVFAAPDDRSRLIGAWKYVGEVDKTDDGQSIETKSCDGLLIYTADGFMSAQVMPKGRPWAEDTATLEDLRQWVGDATAYSGRFEVDASAHTVTHLPSVSLEPGYQEQRLVRSYAFDGNRLKLSGTFEAYGKKVRFTVTWERVGARG